MESNWRVLVMDLGYWGGPYSLIARVSGAPFGLWITRRTDYDGTYDVLGPSASPLIPRVIGTVAIPAAHPHFPFGVDVLPD